MTTEEIHDLAFRLDRRDITKKESDRVFSYMAYRSEDCDYPKLTRLWLEKVNSLLSQGRTGMFLAVFPLDAVSFPEFFRLNRAIVEAVVEKMPVYDRIVFYERNGERFDGINRSGYLRRYGGRMLQTVKSFKPVDAVTGWWRYLGLNFRKDSTNSMIKKDLVTNCVYYFIRRKSIPYFAIETYPYSRLFTARAREAEILNEMSSEIAKTAEVVFSKEKKLNDVYRSFFDEFEKKIWTQFGKEQENMENEDSRREIVR